MNDHSAPELPTMSSVQVTQAHKPSSTFFAFLSLPAELREKIEEHYLATPKFPRPAIFVETSTRRSPALARFLPALALTSHQLRSEVSRVILRCAEDVSLDLDASDYFLSFLSSFPGHTWPFDLIQSLTMRECDETSMALIKRCANLQDLSLTVRANRMCVKRSDGRITHAMSLQQVVHDFGFGDILHCKALRSVHLLGFKAQGGECADPMSVNDWDDLAGLRALGVWMREKFEARGQQVRVGMVRMMFGCGMQMLASLPGGEKAEIL